jgi:hypothetical protein
VKEEIYTDIICKSFCRYFKEGKEEMHCGGYQFLVGNFTIAELRRLADLPDRPEEIKSLLPPGDENIFRLVCDPCDFRIDGCDFRENRSGPPCGGYILIDRLVHS